MTCQQPTFLGEHHLGESSTLEVDSCQQPTFLGEHHPMVHNHLGMKKKTMIRILKDLLYTPIPERTDCYFCILNSAKSFIALAAHWH